MITVRLLDLSEEGEDFDYKKGDEQELDVIVQEVLGDLPDYNIRCHVQPVGNVFSAIGTIVTTAQERCSLCAEDLTWPIEAKFHEYLIKQEDRAVEGHAPHTGLNLDTDVEATFFDSYDFDLGDFFREQLVVALPSYPKCADSQACLERQKELTKKIEDHAGQPGHPAFAVLKNLKK